MSLPSEGFVRLQQVLSVIPVGRTTWFNGVKDGRFPRPVKVMGCSCSLWRVCDIRELISQIEGGEDI